MSLLDHMKRKNLAETRPDGEEETETDPFRDIKAKTHDKLIDIINFDEIEDMDPDEQHDEIYDDVVQILDMIISKEKTSITRNERDELIAEIIDEITGLGPLQSLVERGDITEIMVNGAKDVYIEKDGTLEKTNVKFQDDEHLMNIIHKIVRPLGRRIDESKPYVDARLPDGSRVNVIIPPLVVQGPIVTIREFSDDPLTIDDLVKFGSVSEKMSQFFEACVEAELNVLISGGTGSGKTTTLNCLSSFIPKKERIITIEDTLELQLQQPHIISCEARPPNIEGEGEVTIRELVRNSLRMRPDRIIVGECRGAEALDMLQAMNTGHEGSMTTIHANTTRDAIARLETLVMMAGMDLPQKIIRSNIASAIHLIIQQNRMQDGSRKITQVSEITGMQSGKVQLSDIFTYDQEDFQNGKVIGQHKATGVRPEFHGRFEQRGIRLPDDIYMETG